jgi:hypothetical protein
MNGTRSEPNRNSLWPPSTSPNGMKTTLYSSPPSTPKYINNFWKTIQLANTSHNQRTPDGTKSWRTTLTSAKGLLAVGMENPDYTSILQCLKKLTWPENVAEQSERNDTNSAVCTTSWSSTAPRNENTNRSNSNSNSYTRSWTKPDVAWKQQPEAGMVLQSAVTMPTKNFFSLLLTPTCSSHYPFLYTTCKHHSSSTTLNCHAQDSCPEHSTHTSLNCNFTQTLHDMPSGLDGGLGHLGHLGYLNILDPEPIDIPLHVFIQEEEDP